MGTPFGTKASEGNGVGGVPKPIFSPLNREGVNDVLHLRQFLAGLEVAPCFLVAVSEAAEAVALHDGNVLYRGVGLFICAGGGVAHVSVRDAGWALDASNG